MKVKALEVRDAGTFLPVVAVKCEPANEAERYMLARLGYGITPTEQSEYVLLSRLSGGTAMHYDPDHWGSRTMLVAHEYIVEHFDELESGVVVDVQFILGERPQPKAPERLVSA